MKSRYWYDENTGEIIYRTDPKGSITFDMPYFEKETEGFLWNNFKVDLETKELIDLGPPQGTGVDPRA